MTRTEFSSVMAWLEAAVGKPICDGSDEDKLARMAVYFDMLGDLPLDVLGAAAKQAVLEPLYNAFPPIAVLRRLAVAVVNGQPMTFADAWPLALNASKRMSTETNPDYQIVRAGRVMSPGDFNQRILDALPPVVAKAVQCFGAGRLQDDEICRSQFRKVLEEIAEREQRKRIMPPSLAKVIDAIGKESQHEALPAPARHVNPIVREIAGRIGVKSA